MLIFINHDDIRSLEVMEELIGKGYYVSDQFKDMKYADIIYMGIKGIDNKNRLTTYQETICIEDDFFSSLKDNALIMTLVYNANIDKASKEYKFRYLCLLNNEEFIFKNSVLTAEGLISYLIKHRRYPLYKSQVCILGYGHCAKPIAKYLKAMNADVTISVRNPKSADDIVKQGYQYHELSSIDLSQFDILINTIPSVVIDNQKLDSANEKIMIVDIASYPYGIDHHYAISKGINSIILPSIPSKYAYGYAGHIIANIIEREQENA